jgi:hypothetical protein
MPELVVNNPNIVVDSSLPEIGARRVSRMGGALSDAEATAIRNLRQIRKEIDDLVCSSTWAEDCLYRGADYPPDFKCACSTCRKLFPERRHPRPVQESEYSLDCQLEAEEDPEFAEEFSRLRNDRQRLGSVVIGRTTERADRDALRAGISK